MRPLSALISCPQIQPLHNFYSRRRRLRLSLRLAWSSVANSPVLHLFLLLLLLPLLLDSLTS